MPAVNVMVVVVDGLRASSLGAYGNTTFPTPALDRFAADSVLFDWCFANSVDLAGIYRALWQAGATSLPRQLQSRGYATTLITDDGELANLPPTSDFDACSLLNTPFSEDSRTSRASETSDTSLARLFAAGADFVSAMKFDSPNLVWLHSRGLYGPWDAPLELQRLLLDEGDPPPIEDTAPPDFALAETSDPDTSFRYGCAYAAQVMVLDACWEMLLGAMDSVGGTSRWLVTLLGARGFPLGEHRRVGGIDPRLYAEQLHVPWLVRDPDAASRLARNGELTTHADFATLLFDWLDTASVSDSVKKPSGPARDALIAESEAGYRAVRTAEWCLRQEPDSPLDAAHAYGHGHALPTSVELFVRPDDRWEANDVAKLCPAIVEGLMTRRNSPD